MRRLTVIIIVLVGAVILPSTRDVSARQERPSSTVAYVVRPGDTLWAVAGRLSAGGDRRRAVFRLMQLNALASPSLTPGTVLLVPSR